MGCGASSPDNNISSGDCPSRMPAGWHVQPSARSCATTKPPRAAHRPGGNSDGDACTTATVATHNHSHLTSEAARETTGDEEGYDGGNASSLRYVPEGDASEATSGTRSFAQSKTSAATASSSRHRGGSLQRSWRNASKASAAAYRSIAAVDEHKPPIGLSNAADTGNKRGSGFDTNAATAPQESAPQPTAQPANPNVASLLSNGWIPMGALHGAQRPSQPPSASHTPLEQQVFLPLVLRSVSAMPSADLESVCGSCPRNPHCAADSWLS